MTRNSRRFIHLSWSLTVALLLWGIGALNSEAQAALTTVPCTFAGGGAASIPVTLNNVNVVDTLNNDLSPNLPPLTCTAPPGIQNVGICIYISTGDAGAVNDAVRFLKNGASSIKFAFYIDSSYANTSLWKGLDAPSSGGGDGYFASQTTAANGSTTFMNSIPLRVRIPPNQPQVIGGAYKSTFSNKFTIYAAINAASCAALSAINNSGATLSSVVVTANVVNSCLFQSNNYTLNFGSAGPIDTNIRPPVLNIQLNCTPGVSYKVGLDGGLFGGTNPTQRYMYKNGDKNSAYKVLYGLYHDATYSAAAGFGNSFVSPVDVFSGGSGVGGIQNIPVYGQVPPQTLSTAGTGLFSDTVNITLQY